MEDPYLYCDIYPGVFPLKKILVNQQKIHTNEEKPFKCDVCLSDFCSEIKFSQTLKTKYTADINFMIVNLDPVNISCALFHTKLSTSFCAKIKSL